MESVVAVPIITELSRLAGKIIDIWRTYKESEDRELQRRHEQALQRAQHKHELLIESIRANPGKYADGSNRVDEKMLSRLGLEANVLSELGYDGIVFEPLQDGYGLALMPEEETVLTFWLPPAYPEEAPKVLLKTKCLLHEVPFDTGAWTCQFTLADIASALKEAALFSGVQKIPE